MSLGLDRGLERGSAEQALRAWVVLAAASGVAIVAALLLFFGGRWVVLHATQPEDANLLVVSGSGALWRSHDDAEWTLITGERTIAEGDQVSTALGTVLWITLFDGSTVEVAEDSVVVFERMRSSRFSKSTKHFVIEAERGIVYAALAPRGPFTYSELTIRNGDVNVTTSDESVNSDPASLLFEVVERVDELEPAAFRAAVLRGHAVVTTGEVRDELTENQQVSIEDGRVVSGKTEAIREFIRNGSFEHGLSGWQEIHDSAGANVATRSGELTVVDDTLGSASVRAVEMSRDPPTEPMAQTGVRQAIGKTLRVYSGLQLSFDVRIDTQDPAGAGPQDNDFPLVIVLHYVDTQGEDRLWSRGYYVLENPERAVPHALGTRMQAGVWERVVFDLRNLTPLPRQITSIVLYASGNGYRTRIANVSLTARELAEPER